MSLRKKQLSTEPNEVNEENIASEKPKAKPVAKKTPATKVKVANKPKKLAKKARVQLRASSAMAKPETINTVNDIPTAFFANDERKTAAISGRMARLESVSNRSAAGPTKP